MTALALAPRLTGPPGDAPARILVTASRDWEDEGWLEEELFQAVIDVTGTPAPRCPLVVVHGACPTGGDPMADRWARGYGAIPEPHPASWGVLGRAAGPARNSLMVAMGAAICLAFLMPCSSRRCRRPRPHDSHGASDCAGKAEAAGIEVRRFRP